MFSLQQLFRVIPLSLAVSVAFAANPAAQNLGQVAIGSSSSSNITISLTSAQQQESLSFALQFGTDFSITGCTPNQNGCSLTVTFSPTHSGVRQDAIVVKNSNSGALVTEVLLYGSGQGPQLALGPGAVNGLWNNFFASPSGVAADPQGNVYFADVEGRTILKIPAGSTTATIIAGGSQTQTPNSGDGGPASAAIFGLIDSIAVDGAGNLFISDQDNSGTGNIREINAATGIITTAVPG